MMRTVFYLLSVILALVIVTVVWFWPPILWLLAFLIPYVLLGWYDLTCPHNVLRNYPVVGHLRYAFEFIRPEIQQYFVATNQSGRPYNRELRTLVYERAQGGTDTLPFGTQQEITSDGYLFAQHSLHPVVVSEEQQRVLIGRHATHPYLASRLNISAMSFGALSYTAVEAMNKGAALGHFMQNTGEGGLSEYHLKNGGDICWQIGTGYFGCRTKEGHFDAEKFVEKSRHSAVKMIEIKLSQGAKPAHGGILPAVKVSEEIAGIRGITVGEDCISPPAHTAFITPIELLEFVQTLRELSGGKPVGFKLCIGSRKEFFAICKAMLATQLYPDFITVDGAEGGTGAAPLEFSNHLGTPIHEALAFVQNALVGCHLRDKVHIIASGKVATGFDMLTKLALGADLCNAARVMMFAVGCIQALRCDTNTCPTGVATQDHKRATAIVPKEKAIHVSRFHQATVKSCFDILGAMGITNLEALGPQHISTRKDPFTSIPYNTIYPYIPPGVLLTSTPPAEYAYDWRSALAEAF